MGQSALLKFLQIINAPVARSPHDTGRHVLTSRFEPGCMLRENEEAELKAAIWPDVLPIFSKVRDGVTFPRTALPPMRHLDQVPPLGGSFYRARPASARSHSNLHVIHFPVAHVPHRENAAATFQAH